LWLLLGATGAQAGGPPAVGEAAPPLVARSFTGDTIDLAALRGQVVVLNFWASWCGPCRSEMPLLESLSRDYRDRGVVVAGLSADDRHDRKDAVAAARSVSYFTGLLGEAPSNGFGAPQVLPLTYIISRTGTISAVLRANQGALSDTQLRTAVDAALAVAAGAATTP
jgi:thiol-disulfide isomerase/thioredoxin